MFAEWSMFRLGRYFSWSAQWSILGPLFFLVYINDLTVGLKCNVKLFADDTSLFTIVQEPNTAANDMNHNMDACGSLFQTSC